MTSPPDRVLQIEPRWMVSMLHDPDDRLPYPMDAAEGQESTREDAGWLLAAYAAAARRRVKRVHARRSMRYELLGSEWVAHPGRTERGADAGVTSAHAPNPTARSSRSRASLGTAASRAGQNDSVRPGYNQRRVALLALGVGISVWANDDDPRHAITTRVDRDPPVNDLRLGPCGGRAGEPGRDCSRRGCALNRQSLILRWTNRNLTVDQG